MGTQARFHMVDLRILTYVPIYYLLSPSLDSRHEPRPLGSEIVNSLWQLEIGNLLPSHASQRVFRIFENG